MDPQVRVDRLDFVRRHRPPHRARQVGRIEVERHATGSAAGMSAGVDDARSCASARNSAIAAIAEHTVTATSIAPKPPVHAMSAPAVTGAAIRPASVSIACTPLTRAKTWGATYAPSSAGRAIVMTPKAEPNARTNTTRPHGRGSHA